MIAKILQIIALILLILVSGGELKAESKHPKLANYYLQWDIADQTASELAKWDLLVLSPQSVERNADLLQRIKAENPNIKILVYIVSQELNVRAMEINAQGWWGQIYQKVDSQRWWLKDRGGHNLNYWPATKLINITESGWQDWLPQTVTSRYLYGSSLWDGVFYDNCWPTVSWLNFDLDLNGDGQRDTAELQDSLWFAGLSRLLSNTQSQIGPEKLIVCNGGNEYKSLVDGRLFEGFPIDHEGGWARNMENYKVSGPYTIINSNTQNLGSYNDFQKMRYGLASSLLVEGYYSFDFGDSDHGQLWWYEEYANNLGDPSSSAFNLYNLNQSNFSEGVWRRNFRNGMVLVNSSDRALKIELDGEYEKIKNPQSRPAPSLIDEVDLAAKDGLVLLKPLDKVIGANFPNGSFVRVFNQNGQSVRNGFFVYDEHFLGGQEVLETFLPNSKNLKIVSASDALEIYDYDHRLQVRFYPYGKGFRYGFNFVLADLNGDGNKEILTLPKENASTHLKIFNLDGRLLTPGFFAFPREFKIGADLAAADVDGDGRQEIIVGAGPKGGPHIRIFTADGKLFSKGFFAFDQSLRQGLNLAAADVDGDLKAEIVVSFKSGSSQVKVFKANGTLVSGWQSYNNSTQKINVAAIDFDQNGQAEILSFGTEIVNP